MGNNVSIRNRRKNIQDFQENASFSRNWFQSGLASTDIAIEMVVAVSGSGSPPSRLHREPASVKALDDCQANCQQNHSFLTWTSFKRNLGRQFFSV